MSAAIKGTVCPGPLDVLIVKLPHGGSGHEGIKGCRRQLAVVVVSAPQADQHIALTFVVADTLNEAAARRVRAGERLQADDASIFNVYGLRADRRGDQNNERYSERSDHQLHSEL